MILQIDFVDGNDTTQYSVTLLAPQSPNNTDIANDILSITTLLEEAEESISKPFYDCDDSLIIFIERIDLYSTEKVKKMLNHFSSYKKNGN